VTPGEPSRSVCTVRSALLRLGSKLVAPSLSRFPTLTPHSLATAISSRLTAARAHLFASGRSPGGLQPYGWRTVPNPIGPGVVRAQDPERIEWVRGMVERASRGDTVYSIVSWLNVAGAPAPKGRQPGRRWGYGIVDRLLQNPVLAGLTSCNPGNTTGGTRGRRLRWFLAVVTRALSGPEVTEYSRDDVLAAAKPYVFKAHLRGSR
jgi:hypothetical protein